MIARGHPRHLDLDNYRRVAYDYSWVEVQTQNQDNSKENGTVGSVAAGLPIPFVIFVVLAVIGTIVLRRTPLGRYILAIGNSEKASYISGINISRIKIVIFGIVGFFTAGSAILLSSRLWSANPGMKDGFEFNVIAAVVLGGTSLAGGKGSIFNTFMAAIFFASLNTAMNMFQVDSYMQRVVIGVVLLFAFSLTGIRQFTEDKIRVRKSTMVEKGFPS